MRAFLCIITLCVAGDAAAQTPVKCGRALRDAKGDPTAAMLDRCIIRCADVAHWAERAAWCTQEKQRQAARSEAERRERAEEKRRETEKWKRENERKKRREWEEMKRREAEKRARDRRSAAKRLAVRESSKPVPQARFMPGQQVAAATASRPALHFIPAGTFMMGSPKSEDGRDDDETQHRVTLTRPFLMMRTEVTQAQWKAVMGTAPSHFKGGDRPVERVSWYDAVAYANALSKQEGRMACYMVSGCKGTVGGGCAEGDATCGGSYECTVKRAQSCTGYLLPTEAEWEYSARAGSDAARYGPLHKVAWYGDNAGGETHPVAKKSANAWGLRDMLGNVWEWTGDWYAKYPPGAARDPQGADSGVSRAVRGGSWFGSAHWARSASRVVYVPIERNRSQGFRLVRPQLEG